MRETAFRRWLESGGAKTQAGRNSRVYAVKTIEKSLTSLGSPHHDLAAAHAADGFAQLRKAIRDLRQDAKAGGKDYRMLMPASKRPLNRLSNWNSWLAQYGRFLEGKASAEDEVLTDTNDDATDDEQLLKRFDSDPKFELAHKKWSLEQRTAFCAMARAVHGAGLDWYHTRIPEIRFGRRSAGEDRALGVLGSVRLRRDGGFLEFTHQNEQLKLRGKYQFSETDAAKFVAKIDAAEDSIRSWRPPHPTRAGYWPDETAINEGAIVVAAVKPDPKNLILYGPPGTGKTYRTALEAVKLCDPDAEYPHTQAGRTALMTRYRELEAEKRIAFVTFHQSFDYETFVEGLRPDTSENGGGSSGFRLEARDGIFREICALADQARSRMAPSASTVGFEFAGRRFWKMGQGAIGSEDDVYDAAVANSYITLGWGGSIDWSDQRFSTLDAIRAEWLAKNPGDATPSNWTQIWTFRCEMKIGDIVIVPYGNTAFRAIAEVTGDYRFEPSAEGHYAHRRDVRWLLALDEPLPLDTILEGKFTMRTLYSLPSKRVNLPALGRLIAGDSGYNDDPAPLNNGTPDQFVLIIDEINRANISKVFGELITLIEPDKRLGMPNELRLTLPYSKKRDFGVPSNLHIIGTMNTADRSIALLDTALRRRFNFREMAPEPELLGVVEGIDLKAVLTTVNQRIEYLIDREHRIGHAFFIGCETAGHVHAVMRDKIIPLLQEYFFEDWSRIHAVLGDGFIGSATLKCPLNEGEDRKSWFVRLKKQPDGSDRFPDDAYAQLIGRVSGIAVESDE